MRWIMRILDVKFAEKLKMEKTIQKYISHALNLI